MIQPGQQAESTAERKKTATNTSTQEKMNRNTTPEKEVKKAAGKVKKTNDKQLPNTVETSEVTRTQKECKTQRMDFQKKLDTLEKAF